MAVRSTTVDCTVTGNWEWVITGYTEIKETEVTKQIEVTVTRTWHRFGGEWQSGSLSWSSPPTGWTLVSHDYIKSEPPQPSHFAAEGSTFTTPGLGVGTYKGKERTGGDPMHGWRSSSTRHGHRDSVYFDDGSYAGDLPYKSCNGTAPEPKNSGSFIGQSAETTGFGTASYSGDIPAKGGGGDPDPTLGVVAKNITDTSVRATIEGLMFEANYYYRFEMELWRGNETEHLLTRDWTDSSNQKYTWYDFSGLNSGSTYTLKGFVKSTSTSARTHVGTVAFSTTGTVNTRPTNWAWTSLSAGTLTYTSDGVLRANVVTAADWNQFCERINAFRAYKKVTPPYTFTVAVKNKSLTAAMFNEARTAILPMNAAVTSTVATGGKSVSAKLKALEDALKAIT